MSAVRTHMCFKACGLRAGPFPLAEPCLRRASWLPPEDFLQRGGGLQEHNGPGVKPRLVAREWGLIPLDENPESPWAGAGR
jgi:hypothetical protein